MVHPDEAAFSWMTLRPATVSLVAAWVRCATCAVPWRSEMTAAHCKKALVWPTAFTLTLVAIACSQEKVKPPTAGPAAGGADVSQNTSASNPVSTPGATAGPTGGAAAVPVTGPKVPAMTAPITGVTAPPSGAAVNGSAGSPTSASVPGLTGLPAPANSTSSLPQILPGIPSILGVTGPTLEQCNSQGLAWVPKPTGLTGATVNGACGDALVKWCCTESQVMAEFPDSATTLQSTFARFKGQGMKLYNCSGSGGTYNFYFFSVDNLGDHVASTYVNNSTPSATAPAAASCPAITSADLGLQSR